MEEQSPTSLESRMFIAQLEQKRMYPFLRATRWLIRIGAALYVVASLILCAALVSGGISSDMRDLVTTWGGPEKGFGVFAAFLLLVATAFRVVLLLAVSEGIQLLLDLRQTQLDTSRPSS